MFNLQALTLKQFLLHGLAPQTHIQKPKENLSSVAGEPSPALSSSALAGPPQAACGASRPRLPPTGHAGPRARDRARRKGARVSLADQPSKGERAYGRRSEERKRNPRGSAKRKSQARRAKREEGAPRSCPSFMERGSALRSAPFRAPPPFWELPKKGRSSLPSASHRASTNRGRAAPPRLRHTPRRKQAGKIRAPLGTPVVSFREARSVIVVVGGRWV